MQWYQAGFAEFGATDRQHSGLKIDILKFKVLHPDVGRKRSATRTGSNRPMAAVHRLCSGIASSAQRTLTSRPHDVNQIGTRSLRLEWQ
jgi:hypothetical protein